MSSTSKTSRVKLTTANLHELFDFFELPEGIQERLAVVTQLESVLCELKQQLIYFAEMDRL